ncbi:MAG: hypothetical protein S4CHLAM123_10550 [Chlamydiales bacterium]|nr:hypothetical protein [Chlamydiales bacterium]
MLAFDTHETSIKKIISVISQVLNLTDAEYDLSESVAENKVRKIASDPHTFKKTIAFIEKNEKRFDAIKREGVSFKIRSSQKNGLSLHISEFGITLLIKMHMGEGGLKNVKTAYNYDSKTPLARATMKLSHPSLNQTANRIIRFFYSWMAKQELSYLKKVQNNPTCIHLYSDYRYIGKKEEEKVVMIMDLAKGDLQSLFRKQLTEAERFEVASQMLDSLVSLSKQGIWHRDIKPQNFLYFKNNGQFKVVIADFGLAVQDRDMIASMFPSGTASYMPPESRCCLRIGNGKKGDVFAMGRSLEQLFLNNRPDFMDLLIQDMLRADPKQRISAEEAQRRFNEGCSSLVV